MAGCGFVVDVTEPVAVALPILRVVTRLDPLEAGLGDLAAVQPAVLVERLELEGPEDALGGSRSSRRPFLSTPRRRSPAGSGRRPTTWRSTCAPSGRSSGRPTDVTSRSPSGGRRPQARIACGRRSTSRRRVGERRRGPLPGRPCRPPWGARCRGRTGAPCSTLIEGVSPARPPNRTCGFHRIRLSTCSRHWCGCSRRLACP